VRGQIRHRREKKIVAVSGTLEVVRRPRKPRILAVDFANSRNEDAMSKVISKDGTEIAYEKSGMGPALVLVDGALAHRGHRGGRPLAAALSSDFTVITYDRRGRGESTDTAPYALEREIEDIDALFSDLPGPAHLYGFSSGAVLALRAAAALSARVASLAVLEPPFNEATDGARREFADYKKRITSLLREGRNGDALAFFLGDMLPAEVLEAMKRAPEWRSLEAVAPTLAYESEILGDGAVPIEVAKRVRVPVLVLDAGESADVKRRAADDLMQALPRARRETLTGLSNEVPVDVLAPVLKRFFAGV
jgi:pimeloyl-ACP methyl ester carboxylesterase